MHFVTLRCGILTLKTSDSFFRSFCFLRQNGAFSATEQNQTYKNSLFFRIPTTIQQKTYSLWRIPILTKYRFRIVRKKKKQYIPDADEHLKHSDYRADGIYCFFFFRLYKIYNSEFSKNQYFFPFKGKTIVINLFPINTSFY